MAIWLAFWTAGAKSSNRIAAQLVADGRGQPGKNLTMAWLLAEPGRCGLRLTLTWITLKRVAGAPATFNAVMRLAANGGWVSITAARGPVPKGRTPLTANAGSAAAPTSPLPLLLLAAMVGGLLLNIMPLKALSLVRAGQSEVEARIEGLAYPAGVVVPYGGLGASLLALRAGGRQVGWAFQLQEPGVMVALLLPVVPATCRSLDDLIMAAQQRADELCPARHRADADADARWLRTLIDALLPAPVLATSWPADVP